MCALGMSNYEGEYTTMDETAKTLLDLASDLADAKKIENWFGVNGVINSLIDMAKAEGAEDNETSDGRWKTQSG
ncbi:hypothetical protein D3C81_1947220 [compost metagenome]